MDDGTYPINHSTVSRRYSGSRSSLAVLFDLSNYEIVIVAKSIRCWCCFGCCCYLLSLSIVLFLFSPLSSEHCFEMMRLCVCVCVSCVWEGLCYAQTECRLAQDTVCTRYVTQFADIRTPNVPELLPFPMTNQKYVFFSPILVSNLRLTRILLSHVFNCPKHINIQNPFIDCIIFIWKLFRSIEPHRQFLLHSIGR